MRKKCERWTACVRGGLAGVMMLSATSVTIAQSGTPASLPRLERSDLQYIGAFRLPNTLSNGDSFSFGGRQLAFNPAGPSLFVGSRAGRVAEVSLPGAVNSSNPDALPFSSFIQGLVDPTEGALPQLGEGVRLDSLMVHNNRLVGTASIYYDATNIQRVSHYSRSLRLNERSFSGWSQVWETAKTGFVSGVMASVPAEWRALLGGPAVTGQCCIPIVNRTSWGPAAFSFDPAEVGQTTVGATPLLYYTGDHATLGSWDSSNPIYGATTTLGGLTIIPGTRTALYFGANGVGPNCYGNGTADPNLAGRPSPDGSHYCYDPTSSDKGSHAYPYRYQIWAYDLNDFAAVKAGAMQPWQVVPYGVWPFDLPTPEPSVRLGGVAYDAATQTLYLSQLYADRDGYAYRPVIHLLRLNATPRAPESTASVVITADRPSPQPSLTTIRFKATPRGGTSPYQFKWATHNGSAWIAQTDWAASDEFAVTPSGSQTLKVGVSARSSTNPLDAGETSSTIDFEITGGSRVTAVSLAADRTAPQEAGTAIVWTATPSGGAAPVQYKWWVFDGAWTQRVDWTNSNTFAWKPVTANPNYRVAVWTRSAGSTEIYEATTEAYFAITTSPPPVPAARASSVRITANLVAPQRANTTITWTAVPVGGIAPYQYQWWVFDGATWVSQPWTASNTFAWRPTAANSSYRIAVWVRSAGNAGNLETSTEEYFAIVP